jgi:RNA polymerase sigma-70 factor (ECF subfamily)
VPGTPNSPPTSSNATNQARPNRAIAVAELDGPEVALAAVDRLEDKLTGYHAYHATRADLLRRLGRSQKSRAAYDKATELAGNTAEIAYLTRRRGQLG